jgi:hypothetical protein
MGSRNGQRFHRLWLLAERQTLAKQTKLALIHICSEPSSQ